MARTIRGLGGAAGGHAVERGTGWAFGPRSVGGFRVHAGGEDGGGEHDRDRAAAEYEDGDGAGGRSTNTAVKGFEGWDTAPGLKKVAETWDKQVAVLMGRLGAEKSALRGASGLFVRNDIGLGDRFRPIGQSKLNGL